MDHRPHGRRAAFSRALTSTAAFGLLVPLLLLAPAAAKTPGKTYCFLGVCHRVKTISETQREIGKNVVIKASHYDDPKRDRFNPSRVTSSGEFLQADRADNAASPIYPDGTKLLVWHPHTKQAIVVRVNNAGPYYGSRLLDLSRGAAEKLGFARQGVSTVYAKVIAAPTPAEATYKYARVYAPVPGPIGAFDSIETALLDVGRTINKIFASPVYAIAGREPPATSGAPVTSGRIVVAERQVRKSPRAVARAPEQTAVVAQARPEPAVSPTQTAAVAQARPEAPAVARASTNVRVASAQPHRAPVAVTRTASSSHNGTAVASRRHQIRTAAASDEDDDEASPPVRRRNASAGAQRSRVAHAQPRASRRGEGDEDAPRSAYRYTNDSYDLRVERGA